MIKHRDRTIRVRVMVRVKGRVGGRVRVRIRTWRADACHNPGDTAAVGSDTSEGRVRVSRMVRARVWARMAGVRAGVGVEPGVGFRCPIGSLTLTLTLTQPSP